MKKRAKEEEMEKGDYEVPTPKMGKIVLDCHFDQAVLRPCHLADESPTC